MLMRTFRKVPYLALVLLTGVLVFVLFVFQAPPLLFNPGEEQAVRAAEPAAYGILDERSRPALQARAPAARAVAAARDRGDRGASATSLEAFRARETDVGALRTEALGLARRVTGTTAQDVNYVMPYFVLHFLPMGLIGIFLAAVLAAAMSSVAAELNSLATVTVIDFYRRWVRPQAPDAHYLLGSKSATGFWGLFACVVATFAATLGSLIVVVNRFGSFFYGSILGVFLLAMIPRARATGAFFGLIAGMAAVGVVNFGAPSVSWLWHNVIGAVTVVAVGLVLSGRANAEVGTRNAERK